ncbi:MAG: peptidylprolyl isomerase [Gammaproteobacteria bacterium]|jgi:peptidyl-prolyl cis-trans isomerase B (cyclophilin B)
MSSTITFKTNLGDIKIELNEEKAPMTAANFLTYVSEGFFDNLIFHRVIPGFMIQGGGFDVDMQQKKGHEPIKLEADTGLKNIRGSIAMARTNDPHSATSQFFINLKDNAFLDKQYAVFGQVTEGMDVVDAIAKQKTGSKAGHQDVPVEAIIIEKVEIIK